ncbi:MAG: hypothetical protein QNJ54_35735 [Prochloraceae cyanobacterium]|nr:hypothetical protein [Prochloraceae cyanobacterium]
MNSKERKILFVSLVEKMLAECGGVKGKLAKKLQIAPSTLSYWLQGKIDPGELSIYTFTKIAQIKRFSVDELANYLGFFEKNIDKSLEKFRQILKELLISNSQDDLAAQTGISQGAISKWLDSEKKLELNNISAIRMAAIAKEKGWTIERLLIYLDLKEPETENNLLFRAQSNANVLSLSEQVKLLAWLSDRVQEKVTQEKTVEKVITHGSERKVLVLIEEEDIAIASRYTADLLLHLQLKPENISIATPRSLPNSLSVFDVLLFDLSNQQSPSIPLIESLQFDGDVVAFVDRSLPQDIQDRLKEKVTDVIVKPVPWSELKRQPYFS